MLEDSINVPQHYPGFPLPLGVSLEQLFDFVR